jgi:hypothetical protein
MARLLPALLKILAVVFALAIPIAIAIPAILRTRMESWKNDTGATLRQIVALEAVWRQRDLDGNGQADYWVKDVAGFYGLHVGGTKPIGLIDITIARADKAPAFWYPELKERLVTKGGFYYCAMTSDQDGAPYLPKAGIAQATTSPAVGICTNPSRFGFTAMQGAYCMDGVIHYMVSEDGVVWHKDTGTHAPVMTRATAAPPGSDTSWTRFVE